MKYNDDKCQGRYIFDCSGRSFQANRLIIGLNPQGEVGEGADGDIDLAGNAPEWFKEETDPYYVQQLAAYFTREEKRELADFMIELWGKYKSRT